MKKTLFASMVGMLLFSSVALAQDSTTCTGLLLKNHISVSAEGMGGAQCALAVDAAGAHDFNPAGLVGGAYPRLSASYYSGMVDDVFGAFSYDMTLPSGWAVGGSFLYYNAGLMELNTLDGQTTQLNAQQDMLLSLNAATQLPWADQNLIVGANLKVLQSTLLEEYTAVGAAVDLGARYEIKALADNLYVGVDLKNAGTPMAYVETADPLPMYATAGLAYSFDPSEVLSVLVAGDVNYDLEDKLKGNFGAQVKVFDLIALRGGYKVGYDLGAITAGVGIAWSNFSLDYAFNIMEVLNTVHRVSLGYTVAPLVKQSSATKKAQAAVPGETVDDMLDELDVTAKTSATPVEKVPAEVLEIRRKGGLVNELVIRGGSAQGIRVGFGGSLVDEHNVPLAGVVVRQVDPEISLVEVQGLSKEIDSNIQVIIDMPVAQ